jgi:hypothetical protein
MRRGIGAFRTRGKRLRRIKMSDQDAKLSDPLAEKEVIGGIFECVEKL